MKNYKTIYVTVAKLEQSLNEETKTLQWRCINVIPSHVPGTLIVIFERTA